MSHMVIYRGSDGKPGYHQTDDIHDAVGFVEQMRNDEGVEHARIFRLEEVVFQYKPYYRVELAESGMGELGANDEGAANGSSGNGSGNGSTGAEPTINVNGGNGSSERSTAGVVAGGNTASVSSSSSTTVSSSTDDSEGSKRGLFGR